MVPLSAAACLSNKDDSPGTSTEDSAPLPKIDKKLELADIVELKALGTDPLPSNSTNQSSASAIRKTRLAVGQKLVGRYSGSSVLVIPFSSHLGAPPRVAGGRGRLSAHFQMAPKWRKRSTS